jgi:TnpA family transposase
MPRRSIRSSAARDSLFVLPDTQGEVIRYYTLTESELAITHQHRGGANRLGFAVELCYMRYPGRMLSAEEAPFPPLLKFVAAQIKEPVECWADYAQRAETRREHMLELQSVFGFQPFAARHYRAAGHSLDDLAAQTDRGIVLATALIQSLRNQAILLPSINVIERICSEAITRATRRIHMLLTESLTDAHRRQLDDLLNRRENSQSSTMIWLRQSPGAPSARHLLEHVDRLLAVSVLYIPFREATPDSAKVLPQFKL